MVRPALAMIAGAVVVAPLALLGARINGAPMIERLAEQSRTAIAAAGGGGITADFVSLSGLPSRHPVLRGGEGLNEATRDAVAKAVAAVPGVGGVRWSDGTARAEAGEAPIAPLHCQDDVEALLRARTIRFEESSSTLAAGSDELLDEVATALSPCLGSIIAVTGHTDSSGTEPGNLDLSAERAAVVKRALIRRGIPNDGLRARGVGSQEPVEGLDPTDPANRRIDFSVIATVPLAPTPVDTPGPR